MRFRSTFLGRQYAGLFTAATLMAGADFCIGLVVSVVSGNCLGADAFAAMAAVYPYRLLPDIFALLLADGTCSLYAQAIGRCDREDAARIFSRGLLAAVAVGAVLTVAFVFGENAYLDFMGVAPAVRREALAFGSGFVYTFLPTLVIMYLYPLVYIDGGAKRCLYGSIGYMVIQIVTAWLFCRWWGAAGLAWSVFAALLAFAVSIVCHLLSPECSFRLAFKSERGENGESSTFYPLPSTFYHLFRYLKPLGKVFALGFGTSVQQIAAVVQTFVLVRIASRNFGEAGLSCLAVVAAVESFLCFTKAASQSALPLVSVYYGEGNRSGIVWTMRLGLACVLVEGLLFMGLLLAAPHAVAVLFGLGDTEYAGLLSEASRVVGFFILPASLTFFWGMYFRMVGNTRILAVYAPMQWIVFPLAFSVAGAYVFGPVGFACGFAGQLAWLMIAATWGYVSAWRKNLDFPLMLPHEAAGTTTRISIRADAAGAAEASACVRAIIGPRLVKGDRRGIGMALVAEEVVLVIAEANAGRKVHVELTVDLSNPEKPRLIVRDDGRIFDITDPDQNMRSMSAYVLSRVVSIKAERINLTTAGHNRSILAFS